MKTMSWSRYHCLSWSFMRTRTHLRSGMKRRRRHALKPTALQLSPHMVSRGDPGEVKPVTGEGHPDAGASQ
jgi:hypothetical protein